MDERGREGINQSTLWILAGFCWSWRLRYLSSDDIMDGWMDGNGVWERCFVYYSPMSFDIVVVLGEFLFFYLLLGEGVGQIV